MICILAFGKLHGNILNKHKEFGNQFYSGWKAAGVALISLIIIFIGIFGYVSLSTDNELYERYDQEMAIFSLNENETLSFYADMGTKSREALLNRLDEFIIPKWKENNEIINRTNAIENLPQEIVLQNQVLTEYTELRITAFELLKKTILEDTDKYGIELDDIHSRIEKTLEQLN